MLLDGSIVVVEFLLWSVCVDFCLSMLWFYFKYSFIPGT